MHQIESKRQTYPTTKWFNPAARDVNSPIDELDVLVVFEINRIVGRSNGHRGYGIPLYQDPNQEISLQEHRNHEESIIGDVYIHPDLHRICQEYSLELLDARNGRRYNFFSDPQNIAFGKRTPCATDDRETIEIAYEELWTNFTKRDAAEFVKLPYGQLSDPSEIVFSEVGHFLD